MLVVYIILMIITWSLGIKRGHGFLGFIMALIAPIGTIIILLVPAKA